MTTTYFLDCSECLHGEKGSCDCFLASVLDRDRGRPVAFGEEELRAVRVLSAAGLVPPLPVARRLRAAS